MHQQIFNQAKNILAQRLNNYFSKTLLAVKSSEDNGELCALIVEFGLIPGIVCADKGDAAKCIVSLAKDKAIPIITMEGTVRALCS